MRPNSSASESSIQPKQILTTRPNRGAPHALTSADCLRTAGFAQKVTDPAWTQSVPPAVAGRSVIRFQNHQQIAHPICNPPATAGGTDCVQQRSQTFKAKLPRLYVREAFHSYGAKAWCE